MNRRSVRDFEKDTVDDKLIGVMLHMATQAPSAGNIQEWEFIIVKDNEQKRKLASAALDQDFIAKAPVVIVVCANLERISLRYKERGEFLYAIQDTSVATQNIMLAATALGLGSVWVGAFDEEHVKTILELPNHIRPMVIIPIGYPKRIPEKPKRIPFENLTSVDKYRKKYEFSFTTQKNYTPEEHRLTQPLSVYIEKVLKKFTEEKKPEKKEKKLTFESFLKRLIS